MSVPEPAFVICSLVSSVLVGLPTPFDAVELPRDASEHGWQIDQMLRTTTAWVALIFAVMVVWLLWSVVRYGPRHRARHDHGADFASWRWTALVAGLIFLVVDGHLFLRSTLAVRETTVDFARAEAAPGAVRIEINAHQWAWSARYPGPDGRFNTADDIVVLNDLVVPQGAPVIFQLTSTDVIHGFSVPNMRMKMDAVPGTVTRMWFQPRELGVFEIACAQHCGASHYKMRGTLSVLPRREFDRWVQVMSLNASRGYDPQDASAHWGWEWADHAGAR